MSPVFRTPPASDTPLAGAALKETQGATLAWVGTDQRIYQQSYDTPSGDNHAVVDVIASWQGNRGITPPFPRPGSGTRRDGALDIAVMRNAGGRASVGEHFFYIFYIDVDNHVIALPSDDRGVVTEYTNGIDPKDLTVDTGAPPAAPGSDIAGWGWTSSSTHHVVYLGEEGDVWELYWMPGQYEDPDSNQPKWLANNLSLLTGYTGVLAPKIGGPLAATMFQVNQSQHVVYFAGDNTIRELKFQDCQWIGNNLSQATGAIEPAANSALSTFACDYEKTLHVCYLGVDGAVHELWWSETGWNPDHTISSFGTPPANDTDIAGYACEYESSHHVVYTDAEANIIELYRIGGSWNYSILVPGDGISDPRPPLNTAVPLAGFSTEYDSGEHVIYLDNEPRVQELYRADNEWKAAASLAGTQGHY